MILYAIIIGLSVLLTTIPNGLGELGWETSLVWIGVALGVMVAIDAITAVFVRLIPENKLNPFAAIFKVHRAERNLYEKLGVRKWKDVIPESGKYLCHFSKDKVAEPRNNIYLLKFLRETCYAEIMHSISIILSLVAIFFLPHRLTIALPIATTNVLLQLLPVITQRYNRFRLVKLYRYNERYTKEGHE